MKDNTIGPVPQREYYSDAHSAFYVGAEEGTCRTLDEFPGTVNALGLMLSAALEFVAFPDWLYVHPPALRGLTPLEALEQGDCESVLRVAASYAQDSGGS